MALAEGQPSIPQEETERICPLGISFIYEFFTTSFGKKVRLVTKVLRVLYISLFLGVLLKKTAKVVHIHRNHRLLIRWSPSKTPLKTTKT